MKLLIIELQLIQIQVIRPTFPTLKNEIELKIFIIIVIIALLKVLTLVKMERNLMSTIGIHRVWSVVSVMTNVIYLNCQIAING